MVYKQIFLTIVSKPKKLSSAPKRLMNLLGHEHASMINVFTANGTRAYGSDREIAKSVLNQLSAYNAWLACSCLEKDGEEDDDNDYRNAPILFPKKNPGADDNRTLVRAAFRPDHHENCPFFKSKEISENNKKEQGDPERRKILTDELFAIIKPPSLIACAMDAHSEINLSANNTVGIRENKLSRILLTIIDDADLINLDHGRHPPTRYEQLKAVKNILSEYHFDKGKKISVQDYTEMYLEKTNKLCLKIKGNNWKKHGLAPQGYLIGIAKSFSDRKLVTLDNVEVTIDTPIEYSGQNTKGPYIAIILVGSCNGGTFLTPLRAFTQPIFSEDLLIPVDSDFERKTLKILLDCQKTKKFSICKPVRDIAVDSNQLGENTRGRKALLTVTKTTIRPDFILSYDDGRMVVVETMGYENTDYLDRKKRTHSDMRQIGEIVEHRPDSDSDDMLIKML